MSLRGNECKRRQQCTKQMYIYIKRSLFLGQYDKWNRFPRSTHHHQLCGSSKHVRSSFRFFVKHLFFQLKLFFCILYSKHKCILLPLYYLCVWERMFTQKYNIKENVFLLPKALLLESLVMFPVLTLKQRAKVTYKRRENPHFWTQWAHFLHESVHLSCRIAF